VEDKILIFDAGSGIRSLGLKLQREKRTMIHANIFFTHYHWDHIHGFPFFYPAFAPENKFVIHGPPGKRRNIKDILAGQMVQPYFPVPLGAMQAKITYKDIGPKQRIRVGPAVLKTAELSHPGGSLSYRIEYGGKSIVIFSDHEHGENLDSELTRYAAGADVLIYDACYTPTEYNQGRKGWGHSTWREGVKMARAADVKKLLLFHHDPIRDDRSLAAIEKSARKIFKGAEAAREGKVYTP
jgi:phosphoribosyl 1,2-cyclic phosphodiesterase